MQIYLHVSINSPNNFHFFPWAFIKELPADKCSSRLQALGMGQSLMYILLESQLHAETDAHMKASDAAQCR